MADVLTIDQIKGFILAGPLNGDPLRFRIQPAPDTIVNTGSRNVRIPEKLLSIRTLLAPTFTFDAHCPACDQHSIFRAKFEQAEVEAFIQQLPAGGTFNRFLVFQCGRAEGHQIVVALRLWSMMGLQRFTNASDMSVSVVKMGMLPSLADLQDPISSSAEKALGKEGAREFKRAVGLYAHGIGIGAFVYLRRIFENLIWESVKPYLDSGTIEQDAFARLRMEEKIDYLRNDLPPFLVENKKWYGIVSLGIHELSEAQCKEYFPVVRKGIEIILDQRAAALKKAQDEKEAADAISRISAKHS